MRISGEFHAQNICFIIHICRQRDREREKKCILHIRLQLLHGVCFIALCLQPGSPARKGYCVYVKSCAQISISQFRCQWCSALQWQCKHAYDTRHLQQHAFNQQFDELSTSCRRRQQHNNVWIDDPVTRVWAIVGLIAWGFRASIRKWSSIGILVYAKLTIPCVVFRCQKQTTIPLWCNWTRIECINTRIYTSPTNIGHCMNSSHHIHCVSHHKANHIITSIMCDVIIQYIYIYYSQNPPTDCRGHRDV